MTFDRAIPSPSASRPPPGATSEPGATSTQAPDTSPRPPEGRPLEPLSLPLEDLRAHYEVVVVGSGYGGSIAASRLARAGRDVALIERGRELHPGDFPRTPEAALLHAQCVADKEKVGDRRGLFLFHAGREINVLSGCGLGGTSLINANVSLRPSAAVLADERWPKALRNDPDGLADGYRRAAEVLQPLTYPDSFPRLAKVEALRQVSGGRPFRLTPINVTFEAGANAVGVHQEACTGCGDCTSGCNVGAKNTLLMNYLPDAVSHGASVFTEIEVRSIEAGEAGEAGWIVHAQPLGVGRDGFKAPPLAITADVVVLAAGTLGTTGILLRSASSGLPVSSRLGDAFSGNGDVLGFSLRGAGDAGGIGAGPHAPEPEHPPGPCITSVVEDPDGGGEGVSMIVEDAVVPGALAPLVPAQLAPQALSGWFRGRRGGGPLAMVESVLTRGRRGELERLQTFLVMGADDGGGRLVLDEDGEDVKVDWPGCGTSAYYEAANHTLSQMAESAGGTYLHDPIWSRALRNDLVTVHPLGGCVMADDSAKGVVDDRGRLFSEQSGSSVHDGLYVFDGSVVPLPLGVNPLLTISAITERGVALMAADRGFEIDYRLEATGTGATAGASAGAPGGASAVGAAGSPGKPGLRFTEKMSGFWSPGSRAAADLEEYRQAFVSGEAAGRSSDAGGATAPGAPSREMTFVLTLATDDIRAVTSSLATPMTAAGTLQIPAISPEPLTVEAGSFELLVADDETDSSVRHMRYHLPLVAVDGARYHFDGYKVVSPGVVTDAWPDTSTLYVTLRAGGPTGEVLGLGVLRIAPRDFARQLRTLSVTGPVSERERLELLERFARAFAGPLVESYGTLVHPSKKLRPGSTDRPGRAIDAPAPVVLPFTTTDGKALRLTRYKGGPKGPVVLSHGMGSNPGLFTIGTIQPNLLEYLVANGYDVFLQEWRGSTRLPVSREPFTGDDVARFDFPGAEAVVKEATGKPDVHWVAHCVAGITVSMAALAGTIRPASVVVSQVAAHPIGPHLTELKARMHAAALIRSTGMELMTTDSDDDESRRSDLFDAALRLYPIPAVEQCDQATCRRLAFIYGIAFHHPALNEATHLAIHDLFGVTDLTMMNHLANCAARKVVVAADGSDVYMPNLERLRFPFTFLHGAKNLVWVPESTERTYDLLVSELGPELYRRYVFADHGHGDCMVGASAPVDVYPKILEHLERAGA